METVKRVALNSAFLYGKMLITIFVSLYSTRLILKALGVNDFGVFSLVAGVVGMLSFLNSAMSLSTQRYLNFYIGANKVENQKSVFSSSVILHLIIGASVVILLEIVGFFLFKSGVNIPADRILSAKTIFQFMILSTFFTINAVPYDALINAHENMLFDALAGILESFVKLGIALWLIYTSFDKLILYGILIALLTVFMRILKSVYCIRHYEECDIRLRSYFNFELFKEMFSFASWNLFGSFCNVIRDQGLAIILNFYFGVIVNAAYGIANQVNGQLSAFSSNINKAIKPQIIKSEGGGDRPRMLKLAMLTCKLSFFLLAFFAVPLILEMPFVLNFWLKSIPEYSVIFCQLILIISLLQQLTWGLGIALQSVGKIKVYQIVIGSLLLFNLVFAVGLMYLGFPAYYVLVGSIVIEVFAGGITMVFAHKLAGLRFLDFLLNTILSSVFTICLAIICSFIPHLFIEQGLFRLLLTTTISSLIILFIGRYLSFTKEENLKINELISIFKNDFLKSIPWSNQRKPL